MKTTIKFFAVIFTASFLFSCQSEEVIPSDVQYVNQTKTPVENTPKPGGNNTALEQQKYQL
jgi:hypothetical protein